jgi:hypothetical protein
MKKDEKFRNIIKLFNTKKVISFDIITQQITCSQRTAQRNTTTDTDFT